MDVWADLFTNMKWTFDFEWKLFEIKQSLFDFGRQRFLEK